MTSRHYISIQSFPNIFTVSQTTLVQLIVTANCKVFSFSFGLRQLRQPALPRLRIVSFARTIFNCWLCDANSIMFTCDIRKNERNISIFANNITKFFELSEQPSYSVMLNFLFFFVLFNTVKNRHKINITAYGDIIYYLIYQAKI